MSYASLTQGEATALHQWPLTQSAGTTVVDTVGSDDAVLDGGTLGEAGQVGGTACEFNGTSDHLDVQPTLDLTAEDTLTFTCILDPVHDETTPDGMLVEHGDGSPLEFQTYMEWEAAGLLKTLYDGNGGLNRAYYAKPSSGSFHHLAFVWPRTGNVEVYYDGVLQTPTSRPNTATSTDNFSDAEFHMMSRNGSTVYQAGTLHWPTLFSGHSASMILNHYNAAFSAPTLSSVGGDDSVTVGETGVVVAGTNYLLAQGTDGNFWLTNNATWGSETIKVAQTATAWSATSITATIVQGGLSAGTVYAYVEHDGEIVNTTGRAVTLVAGGGGWSNISKLKNADIGNTNELDGGSLSSATKINGASV